MSQQQIDLFDRDSFLINRAIQKIRDRFNIEVSLKDLIERPTIRNLAKFLEGDLQFKAISKILRQQDLDFTISWSPTSVATQPSPSSIQALLITGATGFLGTHMLYDLYESIDATIYVLIRAKDLAEARHILKNSLQKYELLDFSKEKRIIPIIGDLTQPRLGLKNEVFHDLSINIDAIYHLGAFVHHVYDYQTLRSTNVVGTQELIKLAMTSKKKWFYYISSVVAALERDKEGWILEQFPQKEDCGDVDGYSQTKWVCEKLLTKTAQLGLPVSIFRPCNITGRQKDGICSPYKDHMLSLIKGCIQMGLAPNWNNHLNFMPVDLVSQCIVKASLTLSFKNKVFNIVNRNRLPWLKFIEWLNQYGYKIEIISDEEWCEKHLPLLTSDNALFPLVGLYSNRSGFPEIYTGTSQTFQEDVENYKNENAAHIFDLLGKSPPDIDTHLLLIYFEYLHKCGYIKKPGGGKE